MNRIPLLAAVCFLASCASITPVAYTPQPTRSADPAGEMRALVLANTTQGCVTEPDVSAEMFVVKFVCSSGVGNMVIRFAQVKSITLDKYGEWYRVLVQHNGGAADFAWTSKSLEDMQRLADAIAAASSGTSTPKAAPARSET